MEWIPRYSVLTGRGGTAVYLLLKHKGSGGRLLAPANLCYAALYPALYAGWSVVFCDVDPATGDLPCPCWNRRWKSSGRMRSSCPICMASPSRGWMIW